MMKKLILKLFIGFLLPFDSFSQQKSETPCIVQIPDHDTVIYDKDSIPIVEVSLMGDRSRIIKLFYQGGSLHELFYERGRERVTFVYDIEGNIMETKIARGRRRYKLCFGAGTVAYETKNTIVRVDIK